MIKGICLHRFHAAAAWPEAGDETGSRPPPTILPTLGKNRG